MMDSNGMKNAKKMLEKYGWSEGTGLGLNNNGIKEAIKPSGKFDLSGVGHKTYNDFQWWDHAFNKAAQAFDVKVTDDHGAIVEKTQSIGKIKTKKGMANMYQSDLTYGVFNKTGTLHNGIVDAVESKCKLKEETDYSLKLTDEELFKLCNGLTAHKGARHGLTSSGKLARIAKQEAAMLASLKANDNKMSDIPSIQKKKKKSVKHSKDENIKQTPNEPSEVDICLENLMSCEKMTSSKKKKSRKETDCEVGEPEITLVSAYQDKLPNNKAEKRKKKKDVMYKNDSAQHLVAELLDEINQEPKKKKKSKSYEMDTQHPLLEESNEVISEELKKKKKRKTSLRNIDSDHV